MKKYTELLKDIEKAKKAITDTAKTEKELERVATREAYHNGTPEEIEAAKAKYKEAEARYFEELRNNETQALKIQILTDNAKQAFFAENIGKICEIWNSYEGKAHGEKTAAKIRDELKAATGLYISIGNKWEDAHITIYFRYSNNIPFSDVEIIPIWNGAKNPAIDSNNKILPLSADALRVYYCGAYVENIGAHIKALREAHKAAKKAQEAYQDAVSKYNELTRGNIQHINSREGVNNWII